MGVTLQARQQHLTMRICHIVVYTLDAICSIYALFGGGRAIGESLIFHFEIPDFGEGWFGERVRGKNLIPACMMAQLSSEVSPSLIAYLVRSATLCLSSFFMICRRWVSTVFTLT